MFQLQLEEADARGAIVAEHTDAQTDMGRYHAGTICDIFSEADAAMKSQSLAIQKRADVIADRQAADTAALVDGTVQEVMDTMQKQHEEELERSRAQFADAELSAKQKHATEVQALHGTCDGRVATERERYGKLLQLLAEQKQEHEDALRKKKVSKDGGGLEASMSGTASTATSATSAGVDCADALQEVQQELEGIAASLETLV